MYAGLVQTHSPVEFFPLPIEGPRKRIGHEKYRVETYPLRFPTERRPPIESLYGSKMVDGNGSGDRTPSGTSHPKTAHPLAGTPLGD